MKEQKRKHASHADLIAATFPPRQFGARFLGDVSTNTKRAKVRHEGAAERG